MQDHCSEVVNTHFLSLLRAKMTLVDLFYPFNNYPQTLTIYITAAGITKLIEKHSPLWDQVKSQLK